MVAEKPSAGVLPTPIFLLGEFQDRGAWWGTVHGVAKSQTQLNRLISTATVRQTPFIDAKTNGSEFEK